MCKGETRRSFTLDIDSLTMQRIEAHLARLRSQRAGHVCLSHALADLLVRGSKAASRSERAR